MHLNFYFLKQLVPRLSDRIAGCLLISAFSQDKDEIILEFGRDGNVAFTIRAILKPDFTSLFFPEKFERARANSVDLFKELAGLQVKEALVYENERAFRILFETGDKLVFKLFGNRSNLLHYAPDDRLVTLFNRRLSADLTLTEQILSRPIDQTFDAFTVSGCDYRKLFPTFGKLVGRYVEDITGAIPSPARQWDDIQQVLAKLSSRKFYVTLYQGAITLSLLPVGEIQEQFEDPIAAVNAFCLFYFRVGNLQREKDQAAKRLAKSIAQTENYLSAAYEKLAEISETGKNEQYANLLMANLHRIGPRADSVELESFYTGEPVRIKLKPDLSPAKNAEAYFRKAKNEQQEVAQLQENIEAREAELGQLKSRLEAVSQQSTVKDLRAYLKQHGIAAQSSNANNQPESRFRKEVFMGYEIYIGKTAKNNDELTLKFARKEDLWLHAKDVAGSHVIIRNIPGRPTPPMVVERAAELAAWHSKRRNDSLCPVTVTPRKFVRKSKGMAPGAVIVEKESVVMVVPRG